MKYPLIEEYISSILFAEYNFRTLKNLRPVLDSSGHPVMNSGNYAVVFKMQDVVTKQYYAVKCFIKDQLDRESNYKLISDELEYNTSSYITTIKYIESELFVDTKNSESEHFSVLLMSWIDGCSLSKYVLANKDDKNAISLLSYRFGRLSAWLLSQPFAHGDLKPDNIMVKSDGNLTLVDLDGMYVPSMKGFQRPKLGALDYQDTLNTIEAFDEHIDDLSIVTIALSLKALSLNPKILENTSTLKELILFDKDYMELRNDSMFSRLCEYVYDQEFSRLYGLFLLVYSRQNLSNVSSRLFLLEKPLIEEQKTPEHNKIKSKVFTVNNVSFEMVLVEGGTLQMGATLEQVAEAYGNEYPRHEITLSNYYIGKYTVTQELWKAVMESNPSKNQGDKYPVENVSWLDVKEFIKKLNKITKINFALPTESQWEFAARGGIKSKGYKYAGSNRLEDVAWYGNNAGNHTHAVGLKPPNELCLYDMSGNVWEWCNDWYSSYQGTAQTNPTGPTSGGYKILRGGSYWSNAVLCRTSQRGINSPDYCGGLLGFRLALEY